MQPPYTLSTLPSTLPACSVSSCHRPHSQHCAVTGVGRLHVMERWPRSLLRGWSHLDKTDVVPGSGSPAPRRTRGLHWHTRCDAWVDGRAGVLRVSWALWEGFPRRDPWFPGRDLRGEGDWKGIESGVSALPTQVHSLKKPQGPPCKTYTPARWVWAPDEASAQMQICLLLWLLNSAIWKL